MRRTLGSLLLTTVLATGVLTGCGDGSSDATDPAPTGTTSTSPGSPTDPESSADEGALEATTVSIVSATGAGGKVSDRATVLDRRSDVSSFVSQFSTAEMSRKLTTAVGGAVVPEGQSLVAAVVSIGCDVPDEVRVEQAGGGVTITAMKVASPRQECFAPVTTVALVAVDSAAL